MKQLLILSGKGGTGKTTVAGALIKLSQARAYADCDVDAPNLHLSMTQTREPERNDYYGMPKAQIDAEACIGCGQCKENCRFDAIANYIGYVVDPFSCEGCGVSLWPQLHPKPPSQSQELVLDPAQYWLLFQSCYQP